ncbi:hypothetical protein METH_18195 [Leisingera methylohalidivorans DSM 14336]|uniref:Uncharacterized protein n=1 Tax=Leisingera methylohalidivorans DSM 14336 TaxID=999552 RepID=V9W277_9RHOB|nr:hypothetical protein METH_18195 [Leisingera methylohalidivorans DSM 14336]
MLGTRAQVGQTLLHGEGFCGGQVSTYGGKSVGAAHDEGSIIHLGHTQFDAIWVDYLHALSMD